MKRFQALLCSSFISLVTLVPSASLAGKHSQPVIGSRSAKIIQVNNLKFKDLNNNGKLDPYEDWRLSTEVRSADLLGRMSVQEKVGFMLINTSNLVGSRRAEASGNKQQASDLDEGGGNQYVDRQGLGMFGNRPAGAPGRGSRQGRGAGMTGERLASMNGSAGTSKVVKEFHHRHFILRANESARVIAEWSNKLQALCESEPLGIPAIVASNPRNHITTNASLGTSVGTTAFSTWPGELGLSAMHDLKLTRDFADIARQEWLAVGIRKGYMYMADLSTEPRWSRVNGTFGEDAGWVAKMITEVILGFQGKKLSNTSVALTTKHFPGGGAGQGGQDSHFDWGKREVYPGGMFKNNLIPFRAAIKAGTSSIMPYYSLPYGTEFEEVGYAYNKRVINDLLRGEMGFRGIINSDTGPIDNMPWGVEKLTIPERFKKAVEAGVNIFSGISDPAVLLKTVQDGMISMDLVDHSVTLLLKEFFDLGLFENPYVDPDAAEKIVNNTTFREKAGLALRKSIVLLRNDNAALPAKAHTRIYFETLQKNPADSVYAPGKPWTNNEAGYPVEFVKTPEEADLLLLWVMPAGNALFSSTGAPITLELSGCATDVARINRLTALKPAILVINYTNPWVIGEIYNDKTKAQVPGVLATFGTTTEALLDVVTGRFNPSGKMPFSTPVSMKAVENQKEDVPGYLEGQGYALFNCGEGKRYK